MTPIAIARQYLGTTELTGKNDGPQIRTFMGVGEVKEADDGLPWCAAFVVFCFATCRIALPGNPWKNRSVRALYKSLWEAGGLTPRPTSGGIIFFNSRGGSDPGKGQWHVGLIEEVRDTDLVTIEGNVGDAVRRCFHSKTSPRIAGYAQWPKLQG